MKLLIFLLIIFTPSIVLAESALVDQTLFNINQKVCSRFNTDTAKLAAIMEEVKRRQGITETRVAYGQVDTPIEQADYWVNFAAEAIAYQKIQKYSDKTRLKSDLSVLKNKILRAKNEVKKVIK